MNDAPASGVASLTGVWNGLFAYPSAQAVTFLATLIESGGIVSGTTHEACSSAQCLQPIHNAMLMGRRAGSAVTFTKTYDPPGFGFDVVEYEGTVNAEGTEIDGRWRIRAQALTGKFLMIRAGAMVRARGEAVVERV